MKCKCKGDVKYVNLDFDLSKQCKQVKANKYSFDIDNKPLRTYVNNEKMLIAGLHTSTRSKHIHGVDAYDKSRQLSAMNKIKLNNKYVTTWYAIIDNKKVLLSKYVKQLKHFKTPFIVDTKLNKKIYVNGNIYDLKYTTAR